MADLARKRCRRTWWRQQQQQQVPPPLLHLFVLLLLLQDQAESHTHWVVTEEGKIQAQVMFHLEYLI